LRARLFCISNGKLLWSKTYIAAAGLVVCCAFEVTAVDAQLVRAKDGVPLPSYEVAAVKPNNSGADSTRIDIHANRYTFENFTLRQLIKVAYGIRSNAQLTGGPDQILGNRYDIEAKIDEAQSAEIKKMSLQDQRRQNAFLLQALLADRFHLKVHFETKELPVYALVVAKGGPKLQVSTALPPVSRENLQPNSSAGRAQQKPNHCGITVRSNSQKAEAIACEDVALDSLTDMLAAQAEAEDRPVVNETNLSGKYDWSLHWTPEDRTSVFKGGDRTAQPNVDTDTGGPPLFTALQQQLGLRLQSEKDTVETIVIDHIEPPTEN
jgi:uncharacterized protein (TIGR03435 family)